MMFKSINDIIKEICQLSNITITKAGEGQSLNPDELVMLTQLLDNWKDCLISINKQQAYKNLRAIGELKQLKSHCNLNTYDIMVFNEIVSDLQNNEINKS